MLANGPVSWGVDFADQPGAPPWEQVLNGIAAAGYRHVELGPYGYLPRDAARLREALGERGLRAAGGLLYEPFHDPRGHEAIRGRAQEAIDWISAAGGAYLLLVPIVDAERDAWAGRAHAAPPLDAARHTAMARFLGELADRADTAGLVTALHQHAGTHVETRDELDALLTKLDGRLRLCVDTGHCLYAGIDPVALVCEYAPLVAGFHLKDLDGQRLRRSLDAGQGFESAVADGIFTPLGQGDVDFRGLAEALRELDLDAWATVEQDIDPRLPSDPVADAAESRRFLAGVGLTR